MRLRWREIERVGRQLNSYKKLTALLNRLHQRSSEHANWEPSSRKLSRTRRVASCARTSLALLRGLPLDLLDSSVPPSITLITPDTSANSTTALLICSAHHPTSPHSPRAHLSAIHLSISTFYQLSLTPTQPGWAPSRTSSSRRTASSRRNSRRSFRNLFGPSLQSRHHGRFDRVDHDRPRSDPRSAAYIVRAAGAMWTQRRLALLLGDKRGRRHGRGCCTRGGEGARV